MIIRDRLSALAAGLAIVAFTLPAAGTAQAQNQGGSSSLELEEVTVTARKVEENLMQVPIAVTAFTAKDIESQGIKQLNDVMRMTPSFNFVNQQGGSGRNDRSANALVFRGLFLSNNVGLNAGGQLFIDGAPVLGAQPPPIVDVARIEVLKGPQSAYFGRSTFSGALNFIMREPGEEFGGKAIAEISSFSSHDGSLSLEGPLFSDTLAGRITVRDFKRGGQYRNAGVTGGRLGEQTSKSVSGSLLWRPTEDLKVKLHLTGFEDDDGPPAQGALKAGEFNGRVAQDGSCVPFSQAPAGTAALGQTASSRASFGYFCGEVPGIDSINPFVLSGDYDTSVPATAAALFSPNPNWLVFSPNFKKDGGIRRKSSQADLRIDWQFGGGYSLSSLSATHFDKTQTIIDLNYRDGRNRANPNFSAATAASRVAWQQFLLLSQGRLKDWSQELRIASPSEQRFRWTLGANYIRFFSPGGTVYGLTEIGPLFTAAITQQEVKTPSLFGGAYFDFTDSLTLSVEARRQSDEIIVTPKIGTNGLPVTGVGATVLNNKFKSTSPRVSLDWEYAPNSTIYGLYSKGYRPGGFNAALVTSTQATLDALRAVVPNAGLVFEEEELDNIELGIKSTWLDGRARTQLTFFKDKWKNGQVANSIPVVVAGVGNLIGLTVNNGTADLQGFEFEGEIRATENLKLAGTFGYNDTEIKSFGLGVGNCSDCNFIYGSFAGAIGNSLPTTPKVTYSVSAEYSRPVFGNYQGFSRLDYTHQGEKFTDLSNVTKVGASENANLRFGIRNEKLSVEAFVTNLTDDDTVQAALLGIDVFTFLPPLTPNKNELRFSPPLPRMYGLRVSYDF